MKTVVSLQELVDFEIRPGALLSEYHERTRESLAAVTAAAESLVEVSCPGCTGAESDAAFDRFGLTYRLCRACGTLFVSPRPSEAALASYYRSSAPAIFWRERIQVETRDVRLEKLVEPRAEWVLEALAEYAPSARIGIDVSPYGGALLERLLRQGGAVDRLTAAHPAADLDVNGEVTGLRVRPGEVAALEAVGPADFVMAFDAVDGAADVQQLVHAVHAALRPGGLFLLTATSISGFDLQVLWDRSATITPPDKLNLLSLDGLRNLFRVGWEIIELSTPGLFDVENVRRAVTADPSAPWPRFIRSLVFQGDAAARAEFQEYLQRHRLTSFARVLVRRET